MAETPALADFLLGQRLPGVGPGGARTPEGDSVPALSDFLLGTVAPVPLPAPSPPVEEPGILDALGRGLQRGTLNALTGDRTRIRALAKSTLGINPIFGPNPTQEELLELATGYDEAALERFPRITSFEEVKADPTAFGILKFIAETTGETIPFIAQAALGGKGGSSIASFLGRNIGKKVLTPEQGILAVQKLVAKKAIGAQAGVTGAVGVIEGGFSGQEFAEATGEPQVMAQLTAGAIKGYLESFPLIAFAKRLGLNVTQAGSLLERIGTVAGTLPLGARVPIVATQFAFLEAGTEGLQEATDVAIRGFIDENFDTLSASSLARLEQAALSALGPGAVFGGFAGIVRVTPQKLEKSPDEVTLPPGGTSPIPGGATVPGLATPESGGLVAVVGVESDGSGPLEFLPHTQAIFTQGQFPVRGSKNLQLEKGAKVDITANLKDLPISPDLVVEGSPRVVIPQGIGEDAKAAGLLALRTAVVKVQDAFQAVAGTKPTEAIRPDTSILEEARTAYQEAIDLGFRVTPPTAEGSGFTVIDGAVAPTSEVGNFTVDPKFFTEGNFIRAGAETVSGAGVLTPVETQIPEPSAGIARTFRVDEAALQEAGGAIVEAFSAKIQGILGSAPQTRLAEDFNGQLTVADIDALAAAAEKGELHSEQANSFRLKPGINEIEKQLIADKLTRLVELGISVLGPDISLQKATAKKLTELLILSGFRMAPDSSDTLSRPTLVSPTSLPTNALTEVSNVPSFVLGRRTEAPNIALSQSNLSSIYANIKIAISGTTYDPALHKEGTAVWVEETQLAGFPPVGDITEHMTQLRKLYTGVLQKAFKNKKVVLYLDGLHLPTLDVGDALGMATGSSADPNVVFIGIHSTLTANNQLNTLATGSHELGHAMLHWSWNSLDSGWQEKITTAYNRHLVRVAFGSELDFVESKVASVRAQREINAGRADPTKPAQKAFADKPNYWFSFDEWMADQVARYMTSTDIPLTFVDKFFAGVAKKIKDMFKGFALLRGKEERFRAEPEVEAWLDSMGLRKENPNAVSIAELGSAIGQQRDIATGQALSGERDEPVPNQGALSFTKVLMKKLRIPKSQWEEQANTADRFNWLMKYGYNVLQVAQLNRGNTELQRHVELFDAWNTLKMSIIGKAADTIAQWKSVMSRKMQDNFGRFMFAIDRMEFLSNTEFDDGVKRWPTVEELQKLKTKYNIDDNAFLFYERIKGEFLEALDTFEQVETENLQIDNVGPELTSLLGQLKSDMDILRQRPYFPHSRFGSFAIRVLDTEGTVVYFEQFETQAQAVLARAGIAKEFAGEGVVIGGVTKIPDIAKPFRGMPAAMLRSIKRGLQAKVKDAASRKIIEDWIDNFINQSSPGKSFRKHLINRKNIPGFAVEAQRSFADYFFHFGNYIAKLKYDPLLEANLEQMSAVTNAITNEGVNTSKRVDIFEFLTTHKEAILNPKSDWAQLRSVAFMWHLGFTPASAALNFTQLPMVALPYMAARFGTLKTINALKKGILGVHKTYQNKPEGLPGDFVKALDRIMQQGIINESQASELAATMEGENLFRLLPGNSAQQLMMKASHWGAFLFHHSEQINRRATFRAGWELAMNDPDTKYLVDELENTFRIEYAELLKDGFSVQEAHAFLAGKDAVRRSQFEYAKWARPRFLRGKQSALFMFFMFQQNMVWFAAHSPGRAKYLLIMIFAGGLMGLPGGDDLAGIAKLIAREMFGKDFSLERELREFSLAILGDEVAPDLLAHGVSRAGFGIPAALDMLGLPAPQFDMSANVSMGQLIPGFAGEIFEPGIDFDSKLSRAGTDAAGAVFGVGINIVRALTDSELPVDDFKRWERAIPRALRNLSKAARFITEGQERLRTGAPGSKEGTVVEFDITDPTELAEIIMQAAGFTPTRISRRWSAARAEMEAQMFWTVRARMLRMQFDRAVQVGDKAVRADVVAAIKRFNNEVPFRVMGISQQSLVDSVRGRRRERQAFESGIPVSKKERPLAAQTRALFPDVFSVEDSPT